MYKHFIKWQLPLLVVIGIGVAVYLILSRYAVTGASGFNLSNIQLNNGAAITLNPGTTTAVSITASTTDTLGNITSATALIYRSGVGSACRSNSRNCYPIPATSCVFTDSTSTVTCTANIYYYAQSTDVSSPLPADSWLGSITVNDDAANVATGTASGVDLLTANAVSGSTSTIDYGSVVVGSSTGATNQYVGVQNLGNATVTVQISATDPSSGSSSFLTNAQHYATKNFVYGGSEKMLSGTPTLVASYTIPSGPLGSPWIKNGLTLPVALETNGVTIASGTLYVLGGNQSGKVPTSTVYRATINADGSVNAFVTTTPLPAGRNHFGSPVVHNGFMYVAGGLVSAGVGTSTTSSVIFAPINGDGSLGSWSVTTPLPRATSLLTVVAASNYLYVIGGSTNDKTGQATATAYFAPFTASGTIGAWSTSTPLPYGEYKAFGISWNGIIYMPGGETNPGGIATSTFQYAIPSSSTGALGPWINSSILANPIEGYNFNTDGKYLYIVGGDTTGSGGDTSTVQFAPLDANGIPGGWANDLQPFIHSTSRNQGAMYNGYLYDVAGLVGSNTDTSTIHYASAYNNLFFGSQVPAGTAPGTYASTITLNSGSASPVVVTSTITAITGANTTQNDFHWYLNANSIMPGTSSAPMNVTATVPLIGAGARLRINLAIASGTIVPGSTFALQYATSTAGPWVAVGPANTWGFFDNTNVADGKTLSSTLLTSSNVAESYQESDITTSTPALIASGKKAEWDWSLQNLSAGTSSAWYFRMVYGNGTPLEGYTRYPVLSGSSPKKPH